MTASPDRVAGRIVLPVSRPTGQASPHQATGFMAAGGKASDGADELRTDRS
jgi:hypothetical protein